MSEQDDGLAYIEDRIIEAAVLACHAHPDKDEGLRLLKEMKAGNWRITRFTEDGQTVFGVVVDGFHLVALPAEPDVPGYL